MSQSVSAPEFINEQQVKQLLTWPLVYEAVEQSMLSVVVSNRDDLPTSFQPPRSLTLVNNRGNMLSMPGYIGNYHLPSIQPQKISTLCCKLVTLFYGNDKRPINPLPNILGTILLFDDETGKLKCILEGTEITIQRTVGASLVATKHLYFDRQTNPIDKILSIVGCGVQGRVHSFGFLEYFKFAEVRLWNRTQTKAEKLERELKQAYPNIRIVVNNNVTDCVNNADVIVTSTSTAQPFIYSHMLKENCHINAIGDYPEISPELFKKGAVYIDDTVNANVELIGFDAPIAGQVGDVIANIISKPERGVTIFQSLGMAVEDATVAQLVYSKYLLSKAMQN